MRAKITIKMIIGQYLDRYLSNISGTTLRCTFLSKYLAEENKVVVYSKDLHPVLSKKVDHFPIGKIFFPKSQNVSESPKAF